LLTGLGTMRIVARAVDDSGNIGPQTSAVTLTVGSSTQ
jgi:hypothetical protein